MAHTYEDALKEEAAAAKARGADTSDIEAELERITGKRAEPTGLPEALGSPSAGDPLIGAAPIDPVAHHAGQTEVKTAGGGSGRSQRSSGRSRRGQDETKTPAGGDAGKEGGSTVGDGKSS
ncbi:hypothetical protein [Pseudonocardia alni]|uniref:hypothetical protein n=1 Tax=Pseudonocardia alni TaxID=33907 RepID=UPI0027A100B7|nr:hypothetical protein PaSha_14080 [Pseudonocardia alni]WFG47482.1 hypothetical protein PaSha_28790 [Pseudonocardia alni]